MFKDPLEETGRIAAELLAYHKAGYPWEEMAVLYRTNSGPRLLIEKLMEYNIPFRARDVVPNLYEHWIAQDFLAYIRAAMGERDRSTIFRIVNRPKRYVSRDSMDDPVVDFEKVKSFYQDKDWMVERIENLEFDLKAISRMSPLAARQLHTQGRGLRRVFKGVRRLPADGRGGASGDRGAVKGKRLGL